MSRDIYDVFGNNHLTLSIHDEVETVIGDEFEEAQDAYSGYCFDEDEYDDFDESHDIYDEYDDDEYDDEYDDDEEWEDEDDWEYDDEDYEE